MSEAEAPPRRYLTRSMYKKPRLGFEPKRCAPLFRLLARVVVCAWCRSVFLRADPLPCVRISMHPHFVCVSVN